jgi:hypothetical protein
MNEMTEDTEANQSILNAELTEPTNSSNSNPPRRHTNIKALKHKDATHKHAMRSKHTDKIQTLKTQIESQMKDYVKQEEYEEVLKLLKKLNLLSSDKWDELEQEVDRLDYSDFENKSSVGFITEDDLAALATDFNNTPYYSKSVNEVIEMSRQNSGFFLLFIASKFSHYDTDIYFKKKNRTTPINTAQQRRKASQVSSSSTAGSPPPPPPPQSSQPTSPQESSSTQRIRAQARGGTTKEPHDKHGRCLGSRQWRQSDAKSQLRPQAEHSPQAHDRAKTTVSAPHVAGRLQQAQKESSRHEYFELFTGQWPHNGRT